MMYLGLRDIIDSTDPCTLNPSDPICQATSSTIDPCVTNPNQSFCQTAVNKADTSYYQTLYNEPTPTPTLNPTQAVVSPMAASVASLSWKPLMLLGLLGGIAYLANKYLRKKSS